MPRFKSAPTPALLPTETDDENVAATLLHHGYSIAETRRDGDRVIRRFAADTGFDLFGSAAKLASRHAPLRDGEVRQARERLDAALAEDDQRRREAAYAEAAKVKHDTISEAIREGHPTLRDRLHLAQSRLDGDAIVALGGEASRWLADVDEAKAKANDNLRRLALAAAE